jgi:hypothetical protein
VIFPKTEGAPTIALPEPREDEQPQEMVNANRKHSCSGWHHLFGGRNQPKQYTDDGERLSRSI